MIEIMLMPFMLRALAAGALVGFLSGYYGVFIVQRKMSFLGSGLAHSAFGGVALGLLLNTEPLFVAIPFTVLVSIAIVWLREKTQLGSDTAIGILFSVSVALGIIFLSMKDTYTTDAFAYLFGSILAVFPNDLWVTLGLTCVTIITFFGLWHRWAYATFDEELARSDRNKVSLDDYILSVLTAVAVVVSVKIVGIILMASFLVIPPAAARLISKTFYSMTVLSIIFGISSAILGLWLSLFLDLPTGAVIILVQALIFTVIAVLKKK